MVQQLHIFFFPMLAPGHFLPTIDMAKVFSSRAIKSTMITTHHHVPTFEKSILNARNLGFDISVRAIHFPAVEAGLPEGTESFDIIKPEMIPTFLKATAMLQDQVEQLLQESRPHCIVADMFFPWATEAAAKFGIPRLVFYGTCSFANSVGEIMRLHRPYDNVSSDSEPFLVPDLPHEIKLTRSQVPIFERQKPEKETETEVTKFLSQVKDLDLRSYGVVVNSFYELEPDYVDYYTKNLGRKAWHIGPFLLCNKEVEDKALRGNQSTVDPHECLQWLNSKKPNSVVYVCFGSRVNFKAAQLHEIAKGLEISGQDFIWVVRKCFDEEESEKWFPQGFEERTKGKGKGLIVKGWAPQLLILEHESIGGFVSHCGWNSTLEGVCSGVPFVTWPLVAEQFQNEKLLTDVLRIGVGVGSKQWGINAGEVVKGEALAMAVESITVGEEAPKIRGRAEALKEKARKAVEEGGSSYSDLNALIQKLNEMYF